MKKIYLTLIITNFLIIWPNQLQAQTKLDQVELVKQFVSNWKGVNGKDTTIFWEIKANGDGLECNYKYIAKGNVVFEGKQFWGYDKKVDKFILSSATGGLDAGNSVLWFTSKNKSIIVPLKDISDPAKAPFRLEMEFKSPDLFLQRTIVNNNIFKTDTFNRIKN